MLSTLAATLFYVVGHWLFNHDFHLQVDLGLLEFGLVLGITSSLMHTLSMRPVMLETSFDQGTAMFSEVIEIALSGAGYNTKNEDGSLLVWKRSSWLDMFRWEMRIRIEQDTATIVGPVPLAMRLETTIEAATSAAKWALLVKT